MQRVEALDNAINQRREQKTSQALTAAPGLQINLPDIEQLKRKWAIYTPCELKQRSRELGAGSELVERLLPDRCVGLALGESGIGKSQLLYQLGLCVSAGIPFLGHPVRQGRVLYLDYENGLGGSRLFNQCS